MSNGDLLATDGRSAHMKRVREIVERVALFHRIAKAPGRSYTMWDGKDERVIVAMSVDEYAAALFHCAAVQDRLQFLAERFALEEAKLRRETNEFYKNGNGNGHATPPLQPARTPPASPSANPSGPRRSGRGGNRGTRGTRT